MNRRKKTLKRALLGFPLGIAIGNTIQLIMMAIYWGEPTPEYYQTLSYFIKAYLSTGVIGATFAGTSVIFEIDDWSIIKQTFIHFVITLTVMLSCAIMNKWTGTDFKSLAIYIGIFVVIYVLCFIIQYQCYKHRIEKINKELNS